MKIDDEDTPNLAKRKPDADLLTAFAEWRRASLIAESLPDTMTEDKRKPYWEAVFHAVDAMALSAETTIGVEVKLLYTFAEITEIPEGYRAVWSGTSPDPHGKVLSDFRYLILWSAIQDLRRMNVGAA